MNFNISITILSVCGKVSLTFNEQVDIVNFVSR